MLRIEAAKNMFCICIWILSIDAFSATHTQTHRRACICFVRVCVCVLRIPELTVCE